MKSNWMQKNKTAVITGAAGGIGLETAKRLAAKGMNCVIVDLKENLEEAKETLLDIPSAGKIVAKKIDVTDFASMNTLANEIFSEFGEVNFLMNNAGVARMGTPPWEGMEMLKEIIDINFMGVVNGCHAFIPKMIEQSVEGAIVNTGSKQGITRPPGNYAYNISKACVVAYTESLSNAFHTDENCSLSAHLLIPAFVYTPMISAFIPEKPEFAATTEETVDYFMESLGKDEFYILCPDNETNREIDQKRIQWNADDIIKNRPAMSRWHPDYKEEFDEFMKS